MKYSKQRELILNIVRDNPLHLTAGEVWSKAVEVMPSLGIATVYRNLNALSAAGEIRRVPGEEGACDRFDAMTCEHYHMRCRGCGRIFDLEVKNDNDAQIMKDTVCRAFGLSAEAATLNSVLINGLCADCMENPVEMED